MSGAEEKKQAPDDDADALSSALEQAAASTSHRLSLTGRSLRTVPPPVFKSKYASGIRELWLTNNDIVSLSPAVSACVNLRTLGLENNRLQELTPAIGQLRNLERCVVFAASAVADRAERWACVAACKKAFLVASRLFVHQAASLLLLLPLLNVFFSFCSFMPPG